MVMSDHHSVPLMLFVIDFLNDTPIYVVFLIIHGIPRHALPLLVHRHVIFFRWYLQLDICCGNWGCTMVISPL